MKKLFFLCLLVSYVSADEIVSLDEIAQQQMVARFLHEATLQPLDQVKQNFEALVQNYAQNDAQRALAILHVFSQELNLMIKELQINSNIVSYNSSTVSKMIWSGLTAIVACAGSYYFNVQDQISQDQRLKNNKIIYKQSSEFLAYDEYKAAACKNGYVVFNLDGKMQTDVCHLVFFKNEISEDANNYRIKLDNLYAKAKKVHPKLTDSFLVDSVQFEPKNSFYNNCSCACIAVAGIVSIYALYQLIVNYKSSTKCGRLQHETSAQNLCIFYVQMLDFVNVCIDRYQNQESVLK